MTSDPPQAEEPRRSFMSRAVIAAVLLGLLILGVFAWVTRGGDDGGGAAEQTNIVRELSDGGYKKVKDEKLDSPQLGRKVISEWWERSAEPQQVIITDDSTYTTEGVLIVNAVNYRGTDGKGNLSCQPDPEHMRSTLKAIVDDSNKVRDGIASGSLKPTEGSFPYRGEFMGCLP